jgi:hypothetical protein
MKSKISNFQPGALILASLAASILIGPANAKQTKTRAIIAPAQLAATQKLTPAKTIAKSTTQELVSAPISVRAAHNLGYIVSFGHPYSQRRGQPFLLSVQGHSLKNKTPQEVKQLLQGQPGSVVRISVLNYDDKIEDIDLVIPAHRTTETLFSPTDIYGSIERFNTEEIHPNLLNIVATNNDLLARSFCADLVKRRTETQESETNSLSTIFQSLFISQAIGDLSSTDHYLQLALEELNRNHNHLQTLQFPFASIIKNLVALQKEKQAVEICKKLASPEYQAVGEHIEPFKILECLSTIDSVESRNVQAELIERLYKSPLTGQTLNNDNQLWFGQFLEKRDKTPERALQIYKNQKDRLNENAIKNPSLDSYQKLAACYYLMAQAASKLGRGDEAALNLHDIEIHCNVHLKDKQLTSLNQLPLFFPTPADIAAAKTSLKKAGLIPPHPSINCEPWYECIAYGVSGEELSKQTLQFPTVQACFEAIKIGNRNGAIKLANHVLSAYKNEQLEDNEAISRQNLFCTNLRIARALADKNWPVDSERLLKELSATVKSKNLNADWSKMAISMIEAERLLNSVASKHLDKKIANQAWQAFENNYLNIKAVGSDATAKRISFDYEKCKCIRLLAMNYSFADDLKRAKIFFDRALLVEPALITNEEVSRRIDKQPNERFLLRINIAMFLAKKGDYSGANKYIELAMSQDPMTNIDVVGSLAKTADMLARCGQNDRSISLLKKILAIPAVDQYYSATALKAKLAALLFQKDANVEATQLAAPTDNAIGLRLVTSNYERAAKVALTKENYTEAAKYFSLAAKECTSQNTAMLAQSFLRKAVDCAEKAKNIDSDALATYYLDLANRTDYLTPENFQLREKALTLMSDTNPKKPEVLRYTTYLRQAARNEALPAAQKKVMIVKESDDIQVRLVKQLEPTTTERESLLKAAQLAAKMKLTDTGDYWMALAIAETQAHNIDDACAHARLSIAAYSKTDPRATTSEQIIGNAGISRYLAIYGSREKAAEIFREAIKRVQEVQGQYSHAAQMQLAQYFIFSIGDDNVTALKALDELLATDLNRGTFRPPHPGEFICRFGLGPIPIESSSEAISIINIAISDCFKRKDFALGNLVAEKLIAAERKQFPPGDYRTAVTIEILARCYADAGDNTRAEALYREAKPVLVKHGEWLYKSDGNYRKVLQAVNKQDEVDKMDADAFSDRAELIRKEEERQTNALYPTR